MPTIVHPTSARRRHSLRIEDSQLIRPKKYVIPKPPVPPTPWHQFSNSHNIFGLLCLLSFIALFLIVHFYSYGFTDYSLPVKENAHTRNLISKLQQTTNATNDNLECVARHSTNLHTYDFRKRSAKAYVTIVHSANPLLLRSVELLAYQLIHTHRACEDIDLIAITSRDLPQSVIDRVTRAGYLIYLVDPIAQPDAACNDYDYGIFAYGKASTPYIKIYAWQLIDYDTVVYLDPNTLIRSDIAHLFQHPGTPLSAASYVAPPTHFRPSLMVINPSLRVFHRLRTALYEIQSFDCSDLGFFNEFFPEWSALDWRHRLNESYVTVDSFEANVFQDEDDTFRVKRPMHSEILDEEYVESRVITLTYSGDAKFLSNTRHEEELKRVFEDFQAKYRQSDDFDGVSALSLSESCLSQFCGVFTSDSKDSSDSSDSSSEKLENSSPPHSRFTHLNYVKKFQSSDSTREAYVVFMYNEDEPHIQAAEVLAEGIRRVAKDETREIIAMVTKYVRTYTRHRLELCGYKIREIPTMANPFSNASTCAATRWNDKEPGNSEWAKVYIFALVEYQKIVYLDLDLMILRDISNLFEYPGFPISAAPGMHPISGFNAGVVVIRPNIEMFNDMVSKFSKLGSNDCGDQGFLQLYFKGWVQSSDATRLSFVYNTHHRLFTHHHIHPVALQRYQSFLLQNSYIVHFSGKFKPWSGDSSLVVHGADFGAKWRQMLADVRAKKNLLLSSERDEFRLDKTSLSMSVLSSIIPSGIDGIIVFGREYATETEFLNSYGVELALKELLSKREISNENLFWCNKCDYGLLKNRFDSVAVIFEETVSADEIEEISDVLLVNSHSFGVILPREKLARTKDSSNSALMYHIFSKPTRFEECQSEFKTDRNVCISSRDFLWNVKLRVGHGVFDEIDSEECASRFYSALWISSPESIQNSEINSLNLILNRISRVSTLRSSDIRSDRSASRLVKGRASELCMGQVLIVDCMEGIYWNLLIEKDSPTPLIVVKAPDLLKHPLWKETYEDLQKLHFVVFVETEEEALEALENIRLTLSI